MNERRIYSPVAFRCLWLIWDSQLSQVLVVLKKMNLFSLPHNLGSKKDTGNLMIRTRKQIGDLLHCSIPLKLNLNYRELTTRTSHTDRQTQTGHRETYVAKMQESLNFKTKANVLTQPTLIVFFLLLTHQIRT